MSIVQSDTPLRADLGDFSSIVCFKAVVTGTEAALGKRAAAVALKSAGRKRGQDLVETLGLTGSEPDPTVAAETLTAALGPLGTRLCIIDRIERDGDAFRVHARETVCSAGEPEGSDRECTFTQGAIHGAMESLYGLKLRSKQVGSVLRGQAHDIFEMTER